jgi:hypothetical protein
MLRPGSRELRRPEPGRSNSCFGNPPGSREKPCFGVLLASTFPLVFDRLGNKDDELNMQKGDDICATIDRLAELPAFLQQRG